MTTKQLPGKTKTVALLACVPASLPPIARHLGRRVEITGRLEIHGEVFVRIDYLCGDRPMIAFVPETDVQFTR